MRAWLKTIGSGFLAAVLAIPALATPRVNAMGPAQPGTINYVEGQATLNGQNLNQNSVGAMIQPGQSVMTTDGRVEILLTPGVFLRLDHGAIVKMDSSGLADIVFTVNRGRAMVEVDQVLKANNITINENGTSVRLVKKGLYDFDATAGTVRVFEGQADVSAGKKTIEVNGGHELALLNQTKLKTHGFNKEGAQDDFYRWSSLRSSYLAEANVSAARMYYNGGPGWYGPDWYWDPWFGAYTWIPGDGIFWDPFGWGFYSPFFVGYAPFFGFGFGGYGYHHFGTGYHPAVAPFHGAVRANGMPAGGFARGGFGGSGFARGGLAGGGFHGGGGFGGGRR